MLTPERWQRIEPILDAALDLSSEERTAFIAAQCAGDDALAADVAALIDGMERPDPELDVSAANRWSELGDTGEQEAHRLPARLSGRYRIESEIGRGGMAIVYRAFDERVQREVAIKVLRTDVAAAISSERFSAEVRVTAKLRHANVVSLFDSGESDGFTYFVMPYIVGETLRERLTLQGAQSVPEAVRITGGILAALEHAHAAGIVHRDVKPSNVMIAGEDVLLADFGIARVRDVVDGERTETGIVMGTPQYMSPEQAAGASDIGVASDIYSVGCVLYELLTGERARRIVSRTPVSVTTVDATEQRARLAGLPPALSAVVERALAADPARRFPSALAFSAALARAADVSTPASITALGAAPGTRTPWALVAAGMLLSAGAAYRLIPSGADGAATAAVVSDTTLIELLPYEYDASTRIRLGKPDQLRSAFGRWTGIRLVDAARSDEIIAARGATAISTTDAAAIARSVGAGRFVRREVAERGGMVSVEARLYATGTAEPLASATIRLGVGAEVPDSAFIELADQILLHDVPRVLRTGPHVGSSSAPALRTFARGMAAKDAWDLAAADSAFSRAASIDSTFARAELWLAQVRVWQQRPTESWTYLITRAQTDTLALPPPERRVLAALGAAGRGDAQRACALWQQLARDQVRDFAAWYGAGLCELADMTVVRDPRSPSRWRFRSSYAHGVRSMLRAFEILPVVHREFRAQWFSNLAALLKTAPTQLRPGRAALPDSGLFAAYPSWDVRGDSILFIPWRVRDFERAAPWTVPASLQMAVRRQREVLLNTATGWRSAFPRSADAMLAVAVALDKLGDASAVDSVDVARGLSTTADERLRTGAAAVWLRVKFGVPDDPGQLTSARLLADSLLRRNTAPLRELADPLASLATLTGRISLASSLLGSGSSLGELSALTSRPLLMAAASLQVLAAVGAPADSLSRLERATASVIERNLPPESQLGARGRLLGRAAMMAFPSFRSELLTELAASGDLLAMAEVAAAHGDTTVMRAHLASLQQSRRLARPEEIRLETLLPEADMLAAIGDPRAAIARLDPTLGALAAADVEVIASAVGAGTLVRAMARRAELALAVGDGAGAARWAAALHALWSGADPPYQPLVRRMDALSGTRRR